jgi:hypothetical protein
MSQVLVVSSFAFQGFYKRGRFTLPAPWALGMMPEDPDPDDMKPEVREVGIIGSGSLVIEIQRQKRKAIAERTKSGRSK